MDNTEPRKPIRVDYIENRALKSAPTVLRNVVIVKSRPNPGFRAEIRTVGALWNEVFLSYDLVTGWKRCRKLIFRDATTFPAPIRSPSLSFLEKTTFSYQNIENPEKSRFLSWKIKKSIFQYCHFGQSWHPHQKHYPEPPPFTHLKPVFAKPEEKKQNLRFSDFRYCNISNSRIFLFSAKKKSVVATGRGGMDSLVPET